MKKEINIDFKFKGNREYIQGPDIYDSVIKYLKEAFYKEIENIDMTFHKTASTNLSGFLVDEKDTIEIKDYIVIFKFKSQGIDYILGLKENEENITERVEYPEEKIIELTELLLEEKSIVLGREIEFSGIEKIVSLNKALLQNLYPDVKGKWYFTRLQISEPISNQKDDKYKIILLRNMNFQLTKSSIEINGKQIGYIYFTMVKKS